MKPAPKISPLVLTALVLSFLTTAAIAGSGKSLHPVPLKINDFKFLDINTLNVTCNSNGDFASSHLTNSAGCEWPKGTGKTCIYSAGLWVAGLHRPTHAIRGAFMDYVNEFQPGPLLETFNTTTNDGSAANTRATDDKWRLYKISKSDTSNPAGNPDYSGWPGDAGAPFVDVNGNGVWDPGIDVPTFYGDQQLWTVCNDVNSTLKAQVGTTAPMGIEVQCLYFAYDLEGPLGNIAFLKWKIINRSDADYDSTYISLWTDIDLGNGNNDLPGTDTTLNLGYIYNGSNNDGSSYYYYGVDPPADGFELLQGPRVPGLPTDSAIVDGKWIHGFRNLPMTAGVNFFGSTFTQLDEPPLADHRYPGVAYDYMKGLAGTAHEPVYSTVTGQQISKWFSGNPTTVPPTGDLPSNFYFGQVGPQDVRTILSSGPFTLAQGDTQEVVWAFIIARGTDNLNSVLLLKEYGTLVHGKFGGTPIFLLAPLSQYEHVDSTVRLIAFSSVPTTDMLWSIVAKPDSSLATIAAPSEMTTTIIPDVPGSYTIKFVATLTGGARDSLEVSFKAIRNHPPVIALAMPQSVVLGDTIHVDYSGIHGPQGDSLAIHWTIDAGSYAPLSGLSYADSVVGKLVDSNASQLTYVPFRTSRVAFRVSVKDAFYSIDSTTTVVVKPLATAGLQLNSRYDTTGIPHLGTYQFGRIKELDSQIWFDGYGSLFTPNFSNNATPAQAYKMHPGDYHVSGNRIVVASGTSVDLFTTDSYRTIQSTRNLSPPPPHAPVVDVYYSSPYLFFSDSTRGFFVYEMSAPTIMVSHVSDGDSWGSFVVDGSFLYCLCSGSNTLKVLDISVLSNLVMKNTVPLSAGYAQIRKSGDYLFLIKPDTIAVLNASDPSAILAVARIPVPHAYLAKSQFYDACPYGNYLVAGTQEGCYLYDITDRAAPSIYAKYLTGYPAVSTFLNARRLVIAQWDKMNPGTPERLEGFLEFDSPVLGTQDPASAIPLTYSLEQNYPNPFNPETYIRYQIADNKMVRLTVYDLLGREVALLVNERKPAGTYSVQFDGRNLASGVYFYRLNAGNFVATRKFLLLR